MCFFRITVVVLGIFSGAALIPASLAAQPDVAAAGSGRFQEVIALYEGDRARSSADLHALCFAYQQTRRYQPLEDCLTRLEASIARGDKRTRLFRIEDATPIPWIMRAEMLIELGEGVRAVPLAQKAVRWLLDDDSEDRNLFIAAYGVEALAHAQQKDTARAREVLAKLEKIGTAYPLYHNHHTAKTLALARGFMAIGDFAAALQALRSDSAFDLRAAIFDLVTPGAGTQGNSLWLWQRLPRDYMIMKCLFEAGQREEARRGMDALLAVPQIVHNGQIHWQLLADRAALAQAEGHAEQAIEFYTRAIDVVDSQRATIATEANKIGFIAEKEPLYARLVELHLARKDYAAAFRVVERAKARALVDMLARKNDFALAAQSDAGAEHWQQFLKTDQERLIQDVEETPEQISARQTRALRVRTDLARAAPELASLVDVGAAVAPVSVDWIRQRLEPDEAFVEFYSHGAQGSIFVIDRQGVKHVSYDARGIEQAVRDLRALIADESAAAVASLQSLFQQLVAPWLGTTYRRLTLIPHGSLHYLPFAALHDGKGYLIERAALTVLPSASVLEPLSKRKRGETSLPLLAIGNPDLGEERLALQSAEEEARGIAAMEQDARLLVRGEATETALRREGPKARMLHLAMHGKFRAEEPLQSGLYLAKSAEHDGLLTVGELYTLNLSSHLVTLSACETGLGQVASGNDVIGLTRGFFFAGVRYVVASLLEVDDEATSYLMQRFYRQLKTGLPLPTAMQSAQREALKKYPHPFFWAAFAING